MSVEEGTEILDMLVQDVAQALQPIELDGESLTEDQHDDSELETETLKS